MKLLLISDTHGNLDQINTLVEKTGCDAVVHAGDFGFYDNNSVEKLSDRELRLHVKHSNLEQVQKENILKCSLGELKSFIAQHLPLSDLPNYLNSDKEFKVPIYAVWGNHEDKEVVQKFYSGQYKVQNLNILHEKETHHLLNYHIFGLGGNFLPGKKLLQEPIAGGSGKVWSVLSQYLKLIETVENKAIENEIRLFVCHVSPGKEPFMSAMGIQTRSDLIVSGHMGAPCTMVWNEFTIREPGQAVTHIYDYLSELKETLHATGLKNSDSMELAFKKLLKRSEERSTFGKNGRSVPSWFIKMLYVNLPDAHQGGAVIQMINDRPFITTF